VKKIWILVLVVIIILGLIFIPKMINKGDEKVKFNVVDKTEVPENITENLSKYWTQESAAYSLVENNIRISANNIRISCVNGRPVISYIKVKGR